MDTNTDLFIIYSMVLISMFIDLLLEFILIIFVRFLKYRDIVNKKVK